MKRSIDQRFAPTEGANINAALPAATLRVYQSSIPAMLSVVTLNEETGRLQDGTRLTLGQVIELAETLEEFIAKWSEPIF